MFFIDLNKLKIIEDDDYSVVSKKIEINSDDSTIIIASKAREVCNKLLDKNKKSNNKSTVFNITIDIDKIEKEDFITIVNVFNAVFFEKIVIHKGRERERRLDIPENLSFIHTSAGLLKKAINNQTKINKFNLIIKCNDLYYYMIDKKGE